MTDDPYDPQPSIARIAGTIDALKAIVEAIAQELPERAMQHVVSSAKWTCDVAQDRAKETQNDLLHDYAAGFYDVVESLSETLRESRDELEEGSRVRTVQPAPIDPIDQRPFDW